MKRLLKKIVPQKLLHWYRHQKTLKFQNKSTQEVFTEIFATNHWDSSESVSGKGSELVQTKYLIKELDALFAKLSVESVLDIPCGDFNWMQRVNLQNINYIGADIVQALVTKNQTAHSQRPNLKFQVLNLISDPLPESDIIITRDCLVHLCYKDIFDAIKNIKTSGSKYFLTTTYPACDKNYDIVTGGWRRLNLQKPPFNFPAPILCIKEGSSEENGTHGDKSMSLWEISSLQII